MTTEAGPAVVAALREDIDRLLAAEPEVRADAEDSVHQMRVATRRLRSVLRSYRKLFDSEAAAETVTELKWLAELLGVARDAEVRGERFEKLLDGFGEVPAEVTHRLVGSARDAYAQAHAQILTALDGKRYAALREVLTAWRTDPPLNDSLAGDDADEVFGRVLRRDRKRLRELVFAEPTATPADRVELLHDIRKGAKRLRYSCEAAGDVLGTDATDLGTHAKRLQSVLGDHRDAVESREAIMAAAADATDATVYELLADTEEAAAGRAIAGYPSAAAFISSVE
ncbi:CHAD domain-containing protein [Nocardia caishijiensis]|uniref:CHAD domain-containing protein n=1 Tax=Nocardia caishijiensis TaxID=184756 RepID=A0ABQ6YIP7_9NOCA|nr:CHAD domain-containing protein [Nocardia caishijiensis]KAF0845654.1 CHAD domain-containing protein [Nocardia caishijiensis]